MELNLPRGFEIDNDLPDIIKGTSCNEVEPMAIRQRRYSKEELAQRGQEFYESSIRQQVEAGNKGKIGAIYFEGHFSFVLHNE